MSTLRSTLLLALGLGARVSQSLRYDPQYLEHNLNQNEAAIHPLDYGGRWEDHEFKPSPTNWRFPFYTLFIDRFVNGDPSNDNANGTVFEHDITSTQIRHGGDVQGLIDSLDYIRGMGVKVGYHLPSGYFLVWTLTCWQGIYIAGSPFINQPWQADSYSVSHPGQTKQGEATDNAPSLSISPFSMRIMATSRSGVGPSTKSTRGTCMSSSTTRWRRKCLWSGTRTSCAWKLLTLGSMGDLLGFEGYLNETAPFAPEEHKVVWKSSRRYLDFDIGTDYNKTCNLPRFWNETGERVEQVWLDEFGGCYDSEFDQVLDIALSLPVDRSADKCASSLATPRLLVFSPITAVKSQNSLPCRTAFENGCLRFSTSWPISLA